MGFRRHQIRVLLLIAGMLLFAILAGMALAGSRWHLAFLCGSGAGLLGFSLYRVLIQQDRDVLYFFRALENDDSSIRFNGRLRSRVTRELHLLLEGLNERFREMQMARVKQEAYFESILARLSSGLIVLGPKGHVQHANAEALRLLGVVRLSHINALEGISPKLHRALKEIGGGASLELRTEKEEGGHMPQVIGLRATVIHLGGEALRVVSLQDMSVEMHRKEMEDWIRLIRVMSHEIMNALAPISSISNTLREDWAEADSGGEHRRDEGDREVIERTIRGLDVIAEQSEGLEAFFESYRVLSRIPQPKRKAFRVEEMLSKLETLLLHDDRLKGIELSVLPCSPEIVLQADEHMVTQVLLNLVLNAAQALADTEKPQISLGVKDAPEGEVILLVEDNGHGIDPDMAAEIFMPFFTTREKGTGVGLSYSRQVMALHGGSIRFESAPGRTQFSLVFR